MASLAEKHLRKNPLFELFLLFYSKILNYVFFRNFMEMLPQAWIFVFVKVSEYEVILVVIDRNIYVSQ